MSTSSVPRIRALNILLAIVALTMLAGCVDQEGPDCVDGVCEDVARRGDSFGTNVTRPAAEWDACKGASLTQDIPSVLIRPHLPEAFEPREFLPAMGDVRMLALACPRATFGDFVVDPFYFLNVNAFVEPVNRSWSPEGAISEFMYEVFVNDAQAAEELRGWGIPALEADVTVEIIQLGDTNQTSWTFEASDRSYAFTTHSQERDDRTGGDLWTYWTGTEDHLRFDVNATRLPAPPVTSIAVVSMEGDATLATIVGSHSFAMTYQPYQIFSHEWRPYPIPFPSR